MTLEDYLSWTQGIKSVGALPDGETAELAYLGLGLAGETGEVVELLKKRLRDGRFDPEHFADELGDVAYYWTRLCAATGNDPNEILARSRKKIDARLAAR